MHPIRYAFLAAVISLLLTNTGSAASGRNLRGILSERTGTITLMLLGREGCPGTARTLKALDAIAKDRQAGMSIVCVYVPLPGETPAAPAEWRHPFPLVVDTGRSIAGELSFFFYPTFYVFDGAGTPRFEGAFDPRKIREMTREIAVEKPGGPKKIYSLIPLAEGSAAPDLTGKTLKGEAVSLSGLRGKRATLFFFSRTNCPFTMAEMENLRTIAAAYRDKGAAAVIINDGQALEDIRGPYRAKAQGLPVVWDEGSRISRSFGVEAVPYYFVLDGAGVVKNRGAFTASAASGALDSELEQAQTDPGYPSTGAG